MKIIFPSLLAILFLAACASSPTQSATITNLKDQSSLDETSGGLSTAVGGEPDLSEFLEAWNSGDLTAIRSLYAPDARYYHGTDLDTFAQQQGIDALVSSKAFEDKVKRGMGSMLQTTSIPIRIYEKLIAFSYLRDTGMEPEEGVTILRLENGKILLQVDIPVSESPGTISAAENIDLQEVLRVWNEADLTSAKTVYQANAAVLSDEDLIQTPWRDYQTPPTLQALLFQFKGWNPQVVGEPIRVGDTLLFSWRWFDKDFPIGYGLCAIQAGEAGITKDIRMVIRPWETTSSFMIP